MKILLVEDSERLRRSISVGLRSFGYGVDLAEDGQQALVFIENADYDIIILDLMLPKIDGFTVLSTMRKRGNQTHVLILSAKDTTENRIAGLDLGADDYLIKPFSFDELVARIRALIRRQTDNKDPALRIRSVLVDTITHNVNFEGNPVLLTPSEFTILEHLGRRRGQVFSHKQLIDQLYDSDTFISKNAIEAHISQIRKKLKAAGAPALIQTKRGFGYYIE